MQTASAKKWESIKSDPQKLEAYQQYQRDYWRERKSRDPVFAQKVREDNLWFRINKKYGISKIDFQSMLDKQHNKCAICRLEFSSEHTRRVKVNSPHIDHDHGTGRVRGLLCSHCNAGIGNLGDSVDRLEAAIAYLTTGAA